jgi:hypothetical protein
MSRQKAFRLLHLLSTGGFLLCAAYLLIISLLQAGRGWLFIISVSGYSAVLSLLLVSVYLFALFRGATRNRKTEIEHPLTSSQYYSVFYDSAPFVGMAAGLISAVGAGRLSTYAFGAAMGCFATTFLVWIVFDPLTGLLETLLPGSRKLRRERLALTRMARKEAASAKLRTLAEVNAAADLELKRWRQALSKPAETLAALVADDEQDNARKEEIVVDMGVKAWRMGGLACMRLLHSMAAEICGSKHSSPACADSISLWWDGIGSWRSQLS